MKKIGITGGIGSGKSTVCKILEAMGYPVYYSDIRSKNLVETDPEIKTGLIQLLGEEVYLNGKLDRFFLAQKIFQDDVLRERVNAIIHPRVRASFDEWAKQQTSPLVFNEAAILFETGGYKQLDLLILVTAPMDLKIQRVIQRDHTTEAQVRERMSKQWTDEQKIPLADFVIVNDDQHPLIPQIEGIIATLVG